jgi:hypothetical protein
MASSNSAPALKHLFSLDEKYGLTAGIGQVWEKILSKGYPSSPEDPKYGLFACIWVCTLSERPTMLFVIFACISDSLFSD